MADNQVIVVADDVAIITETQGVYSVELIEDDVAITASVNGEDNLEVQVEAIQLVEYTDNGPFVVVARGGSQTFTQTGQIKVITDADANPWYNDTGRDLVIVKIRLFVKLAPSGDNIIVDLHRNGTTYFTDQNTRPKILEGENTATFTVSSNNILPDGEYITFNIDQVGSTVPGSDLQATVIFN